MFIETTLHNFEGAHNKNIISHTSHKYHRRSSMYENLTHPLSSQTYPTQFSLEGAIKKAYPSINLKPFSQ